MPPSADPRAHLRRRRRLRHEDAGLRRVRGAALRGAPPRPARALVRHPPRELPGRHRTAATACSRASWRWTPAAASSALRVRTRVGIGAYTSTFSADLRHQQHEELPVERVRDPGHPDRRADRAHQRGTARARTAAPAGRRRSTSSSACSTAPRGRPGSIASSCAAATSSRPPRCPTARRTARSTTAASSRRSWTRRSRSRTGRASRARRAASERAGRLRGIGLACFLEVAGGILDETVDVRFAGRRDGGAAHRRPGHGAGTSLDLSAPRRRAPRRGPERGAADRGRQRRGAGGHAQRRLALAHDGRQRHRARVRRGHRQGPSARRATLRGRALRRRVHGRAAST